MVHHDVKIILVLMNINSNIAPTAIVFQIRRERCNELYNLKMRSEK